MEKHSHHLYNLAIPGLLAAVALMSACTDVQEGKTPVTEQPTQRAVNSCIGSIGLDMPERDATNAILPAVNCNKGVIILPLPKLPEVARKFTT